MEESLANGRQFIYRQARVLERRLFASRYEGAPPSGVIDAPRAYRNEDGGFGQGLPWALSTPGSPPAPATAGNCWRKPSCPMAATTCPRSSSS